MNWLPSGATGAVCLSIDDVHPSADRVAGTVVFDHLQALLERHARLKATLFVTPDWRPAQLVRTRMLARLPLLAKHVYHVDLHPEALLRLDRHAEFVERLRSLPRTEVAPHGLHHVHRGAKLAVEFQRQTHAECLRAVRRAMEIFERAGLPFVKGFCPPGWSLPPPLLTALEDLAFRYVTAARDIKTPIRPGAINAMSGLRDVSIVGPQWIGGGRIVHLPVNFQATSPQARAFELIDAGGLVSIKAHAFKSEGGHTMLDGLDERYVDYLEALFSALEQRYGDSIWWASMSEIAAKYSASSARLQ